MTLIKHTDFVLVPPNGTANLYATLKPTRFAIYIPYLSIQVTQYVLDATIAYLMRADFAKLTLEEFLSKLGY